MPEGYEGTKVVIRDGVTIDVSAYAIAGNGSAHGTTFVVEGGSLTSTHGTGIYHPQMGSLTVSGDAEITGAGAGIELRAGHLTVSGGSITGTDVPTQVDGNGNGTTTSGAGLAVVQHSTQLPITVDISGGTISGFTGFLEQNAQENPPEALASITLNITGGCFQAIKGGTNAVFSEDFTGFITGGYFTSNPAPYLAPGKAPAAGSQIIDGETYYYTVADDTRSRVTAVSAGTPDVSVPDGIGITEDALLDAAGDAATASSLADAAVNLQNDAGVVGTEEAAITELQEANKYDGISPVTVVVEPYLKVEITGHDADAQTVTAEIGAYYNVKATTGDPTLTKVSRGP